MNELNIPRISSLSAFPKRCATPFKMAGVTLRMAVVVSLATVIMGCGRPTVRSQAGSRDHLVGWFKLPGRNEKKEFISGHDTLILVFKRDGTYYSVCWGFEIPFKEYPEGLEWGLAPSSMTGTKIGWDAASKAHYLAVMDQQASNYSDGRYGCGEKEPMTRIETPAGLLDAKARRPRTHDDFLGWYQPLWFPEVRIEIRKDGDRYVSQEQEFSGPKPGSWKTRVESCELRPLPDRLGLSGFDKSTEVSLTYNEALKRFELVKTITKTIPSVIRMPLARVSAPSSPEGGDAPSPMAQIGIPAWH